MTSDEFTALQRARAEQYAPAEAISEQEFVSLAGCYPLDVLRQASMRYSPARGRNHKQVLARFTAFLENEHINCGDDFRIALGHIEATYRWMAERGVQ
jgi:hypothetical protein